jgi:hypothetical protein
MPQLTTNDKIDPAKLLNRFGHGFLQGGRLANVGLNR